MTITQNVFNGIGVATVASWNSTLEHGAYLREPFTFTNDCTCGAWYQPFGTAAENTKEQHVSFFVFALTASTLCYYLLNAFRATCGWEECFVCIIEGFAAAISAWPQLATPYTIYLSTGQRVQWLRYLEWLMTCPVILIHLSNLTGMKSSYSTRTMGLIVSDIGCICTGVTCALTNGYAKIIWFIVSCAFGLVTYVSAWKTYREAYAVVPDTTSKRIVIVQAIIYYIAWSMYALLFALGPEGFGIISYYALNIGYTINDMFSKNLWGLLGHTLRLRAHKASSEEGWVLPRSRSSMDQQGKQQDQQAWVAGMQEFTSNTMLLLAEMHKRIRGEDPADDQDEHDNAFGTTKLIGVASNRSSRRRSMGDMIADDVIRCAKSRQSIGSNEVNAETARKSQEALKALLGDNFEKVMEMMASNGGVPPMLAPPAPISRNDSARSTTLMENSRIANSGGAPVVPSNSNVSRLASPRGSTSTRRGGQVMPLQTSGGSNVGLLSSPSSVGLVPSRTSLGGGIGSVKYTADLPIPTVDDADMRSVDL